MLTFTTACLAPVQQEGIMSSGATVFAASPSDPSDLAVGLIIGVLALSTIIFVLANLGGSKRSKSKKRFHLKDINRLWQRPGSGVP